MKPAKILLLLALLGSVLAWQQSVSAEAEAPLAYPDGYRGWVHVKSGVISPAHKRFPSVGGFQHIYANTEATVGYRTREFPEGSIIVFEWLEMRDNEGAFEEGPRRQVDVMVRDSLRYATTGGWGFERFIKDSKTNIAATPTKKECFDCHEERRKDGLVLSVYRP